ncbi:trifunctional transcriptional regulator/proline dehydrogenase/L-glutamate gamma-semialdehyde dehydrogenase [Ancylobacter sp. A5.8]|nr:trifunctional transcriptional regulator/proline dehydrogenase/L-glutamate gamma-semialdehyde dehydrogenase [Ancylobacter gelatini]
MADSGVIGALHEGPFVAFARGVQPQSVLRARITGAYRAPEPECVPLLISEAVLPAAREEAAKERARGLVAALRAKGQKGPVEGLIHEYALSSQEGVALMCLAEALLRIPDRATRDALIRDKIGHGDWHAHVGQSPSLFVNAATWGLVLTGKLTSTSSETGLSGALTRLIGRGGEPLIRKGVDVAMRMMGEQFVTGQTISEALANSRAMEAKGFRYSFDMLGEAATTEADAQRYLADYEQAIHAIGKASAGRGIYEGPGISIKLSALHPRYSRAQYDRVINELLPRVLKLAKLARHYDIGLNIDAEEADRLEVSLDLLEALCFDEALAGWNGIGFVVQAYQKRCPYVLDYLIDLARRSGHRLMVRLVKGAYWDSEIKRAQVDGLEGFPVFTRKVHTDVSYLACARKLLAAPDAVFPQFATHNAQTLATVMEMAGQNYYAGQYEFQCLHGMGEPLYEEVVGKEKMGRPCRIYAPVGTHETLLAYLVRRLLENGANSSFVNRIADESVPIDELIENPVDVARRIAPIGAPHPKIGAPVDIFGADRRNSAGLDLSNEQRLASLAASLLAGSSAPISAAPMIADLAVRGGAHSADLAVDGTNRIVTNPADQRDRIGGVTDAATEQVQLAMEAAAAAAPIWQSTPPEERATCLNRAAELMEARLPSLIGIVVREAGKSFANAVGEVREAVDFLRYYASQLRDFSADTHRPLGPVVCISPWNFPLAIFTGQVAAALAAGNPVLAKPAEETPLIAAAAVRILREAGIPAGAVQLLPGAGDVGAALVGDPRTRGVMFTGSTEVARLIQRQLAGRLSPEGRTIPLIAETGGQNAMVVDSSALAEQVVADVLASAFDSAGQRCSALRILCVQEDVADRMLTMLKGALAELRVGNPVHLSTDIGPVISAEAKANIEGHIQRMREAGHAVEQLPLPEECAHGTFVPPTLIEIGDISELTREVFGPVLHVVRYAREDLDKVLKAINDTGYGLTFGLHTRIDETIAHVTERVGAGNIYVNRNIIGAVVGVQPFGGHGLSGTGPKAGGPLYLRRLLAQRPSAPALAPMADVPEAARLWVDSLTDPALRDLCGRLVGDSRFGYRTELAGPVGERNVYELSPRGTVLCLAATEAGLAAQIAVTLATGNRVLLEGSTLPPLPAAISPLVSLTTDIDAARFDAVLFEGDVDALRSLNEAMAGREGPIIMVHGLTPEALARGETYPLEMLMLERSTSTNTAAAGGNASLMSIG